jgi:hypothetical protein
MTEYFIHVKKDAEPMYQNCGSFREAIRNITDFDVDMDEELAQLLESYAQELDTRLYEGLPMQTCISTMQEQLKSCAVYWEIEASGNEISYADDISDDEDEDEDDW